MLLIMFTTCTFHGEAKKETERTISEIYRLKVFKVIVVLLLLNTNA